MSTSITPVTDATIKKIQHLKELDAQVKDIDDALTSIEHIRSNYKDYRVLFFENNPFDNSVKFNLPLSVTIDIIDRMTAHYEAQRKNLLLEASELLK